MAALLPPSLHLPPEWEHILLKGPLPVLATMFALAYLVSLREMLLTETTTPMHPFEVAFDRFPPPPTLSDFTSPPCLYLPHSPALASIAEGLVMVS